MALTIKMNLDTAGINKGLSTTNRKLQLTAKKMDAMSASFASSAALAAGSLGGLIFAGKKLVDTYAVQEQAEKRLSVALRNSGNAANVSLEEMKEYASGLQQVTTYGDEAIISAQAMLLGISGPVTQENIKGATKAMLDMSTAMGIDLKQAAQSLGIVLTNPAEGLTRLKRNGIDFTESQKKMITTLVESGKKNEAHGFIIEELNKKFGGQAEAAAEGTGAITQMTNAMGDAAEVIGKELTPVFTEASLFLKGFFETIGNNENLIKNLARYIKAAGIVLAAYATYAGTAAIATKVMALGLRSYGLAAGAASAALKYFTTISKTSVISLNSMKWAVKGLIGSTGLGLLVIFLPEIIEFVIKNIDTMKDFFMSTWDSIMESTKKFLSSIKWLLKTLGNYLANPRDVEAREKNAEKINAQYAKELLATSKFYKDKQALADQDFVNTAIQAEKKRLLALKNASDAAGGGTDTGGGDSADSTVEKTKLEKQALRDIELEHINLLRDMNLEDSDVKDEKRIKEREKILESKRLTDEELAEVVREGIDSKDEVEKQEATKAATLLGKRKKANDKFEDDKTKAREKRQKETMQRTTQFLGNLSTLMSSENRKQFELGKAAAIANSMISTVAAGIDAFEGTLELSKPLGPLALPIAIAAGAAAVTAGMVQVNMIRSQKMQRAQLGGIVGRMDGTPLSGDHQPMMLEAGEMIVPGKDVEMNRRANKLIVENAQVRDDFFSEDQRTGVDISFVDDASSFLRANLIEDRALGIGVT